MNNEVAKRNQKLVEQNFHLGTVSKSGSKNKGSTNFDMVGLVSQEMKDLEMMNDNLKLEVKNLKENNRALKQQKNTYVDQIYSL